MQAHSWLRISPCLPALAAGLALLLPACASNAGTDGPSGSDLASLQITPRPPQPPDAGLPPAPSDDGGADAGYFSCDQDDDCVAVPHYEDCCYNGWKIAVSRSEATQYLAATECATEQGHVCPLYIVFDTRVATCYVPERTCAMVEPTAPRPINPAPITPE